ncbi:MAG: nucleoside deaminase [Actinomycetota bacterium]|nr:nucleoside deaminase [Actinomycetota bacterium]
MGLAVDEALRSAVAPGGGPFGALVARDGEVIAVGRNEVVARRDPTAHAEVVAIRAACAALGSFQLAGCELYASCEPCPMCLGAIYWARPRAVYFAATRADAAAAGFDDEFIYEELGRPVHARTLMLRRLGHPQAGEPFEAWTAKPGRVDY